MRVFHHTEPGGKEANEDFLIASRHPNGGGGYICLLADGQGGTSNGAKAARTACETAWNLAANQPFESLLSPETWLSILEKADEATAATGGFTTLIALAIRGDIACGASCGDSKVYFALSSPESEINEWTNRQSKNPPVGSGFAVFKPFIHRAIGGGRVLVVSDGVWKYCGYDTLRDALKTGECSGAAAALRSAITRQSAVDLPDDFTVIAIDID